MRKGILAIGLLVSTGLFAQELNCDVKVIMPRRTMTDQSLLRDIEVNMSEFMNNRKWTNDSYEPHEKIKCQFVITMSETEDPQAFTAEVSIVSSRPVYNSDYETVVFNHYDKDWGFGYVYAQPLEYTDGVYRDEITAFLAYYAYIIIGLDYDSFGKFGGTPWFQKAQDVVNSAQNSGSSAWKSAGTIRNRYWLVENLQSPKYNDFRTAFYTYHLNALDEFYTNPATAAKTIIGVLNDLEKVNKDYPNSMIMQVFFTSKKQELMDIFAGAAPTEKVKAYTLLCRLDPTNCEAYKKAIG